MSELIVLMGIQGSGKSTFYQQRFADTHLRINLDMLGTRHREQQLLETCIRTETRVVVDNTNPASADRAPYLEAARTKNYHVVGYYFATRINAAIARNQERKRVVPTVAVRGTRNRLELPTLAEGFHELFYVTIDAGGSFQVQAWQDEV